MSTKFNQCPNCGKKPARSMLGREYTKIYECKDCGTLFCYANCGERCPDCGSKDKREVGSCASS